MSSHAVQSYNDSDGTVGQSSRPCQSSWMAHWTDTSCKSAVRASLNFEFKEDDHDPKRRPLLSGPEIETSISIFAKRSREVNEVRTAKIMDERRVTSSEISKKGGCDQKPFPMFNICQNKESTLTVKNNQTAIHSRELLGSHIDPTSGHDTVSLGKRASHSSSVLEWAPLEAEIPSKKCHFQPPEGTVKFHDFFEKKSVAASRSLNDEFMGSTSKSVPYVVQSKTPILSMCIGEETNPSSSLLASKEHFVNGNYQSYSAFLVNEKKIDHILNSRRPGISLSVLDDAALSLHDPSAHNNQLPVIVGKQRKKPRDHFGIGSLSSGFCHPVPTESEKLYQGCYSLPRVPCSVSDVETMRICTTLDSLKELSGYRSEFHQTTHHLLITEETGVNLSQAGQMLRESTLSAKLKGKMLSEFLSLSQDIGLNGRQGVKLQLLGSSTDSEEKENSGHVKTSAFGLKNESSADTDTMEMNALQENHLSGTPPSPSKKDVNESQVSPTSPVAVASAGGVTRQRLWNTELPDINQRLPALPAAAAASSVDDRDTSSSRTQSLDVERLFSHAEPAADSKPNAWPGSLLGPEPSSRWVKRLKLSASDYSAHGTQSSKMGETSREKANKFFNKIMKGSITSSEATKSRCGKEKIPLTEPIGKVKDKTLAHSWVRRWCHNQASTSHKNPEAVVLCEPETFKATSDEFRKKKFPSIAAMALMGKAMNGFRPCEFRKMGSSVVWNTKGF